MSYFAQVAEGNGNTGPEPDRFTLWENAEGREEVENMVGQKFIRERGGIPKGQGLTFTVWTYQSSAPTHPNGRPMMVHATTFHARHEAGSV
jgi:hypothetical protein